MPDGISIEKRGRGERWLSRLHVFSVGVGVGVVKADEHEETWADL